MLPWWKGQGTPMSKEAPQPDALQIGLFTGELVDTRTETQKREYRRRERVAIRQRQLPSVTLFHPQEMVQFGVTTAHPKQSLPIHDRLQFVPAQKPVVETRPVEEIQLEADTEARKRTSPLFPLEQYAVTPLLLPARCLTSEQEATRELAYRREAAKLERDKQEKLLLVRLLSP